MSDFLRDYLNVVWFAAIALVLASLLLGISAERHSAAAGDSQWRRVH